MTEDTMSYNGWTNWETWNVALWINNEEPLYRAVKSYVRQKGGSVTKAQAEEFTRLLFPQGTPDMKSADPLDAVDWSEIVGDWLEHRP